MKSLKLNFTESNVLDEKRKASIYGGASHCACAGVKESEGSIGVEMSQGDSNSSNISTLLNFA